MRINRGEFGIPYTETGHIPEDCMQKMDAQRPIFNHTLPISEHAEFFLNGVRQNTREMIGLNLRVKSK